MLTLFTDREKIYFRRTNFSYKTKKIYYAINSKKSKSRKAFNCNLCIQLNLKFGFNNKFQKTYIGNKEFSVFCLTYLKVHVSNLIQDYFKN